MKKKVFFTFLGDLIALYFGLFVTLILRYEGSFYEQFIGVHLVPFTIIFFLWIVIFYIAGLYDLRHLRNNLNFLKILGAALGTNFVLAVLFFYVFSPFGIAPKTNLFLFLVVFSFVEFLWRRLSNGLISSGEPPNKILLVGEKDDVELIEKVNKENPIWLPQLGYRISSIIGEKEIIADPTRINRIVAEKKINVVVIPRRLKNNPGLTKELYNLLNAEVEIYDIPSFYQIIARKVPLSDLEESWFLENLSAQQKFYDPLKRAWELVAALLLGIVLLPLELLVALMVKLTSRGPIIYTQTRIGEHGKEFVVYKFRTMKMHENHSWPEKNDERITTIGKFLRKTHLDELPQLWNVVKGDVSVVGPRPDFVDFYKKLESEIPYYSIRTIIKPGLTGWAQVHKPIIASVDDTKERLEYDIYYIKNRSLILDLAILLKTFKVLLMAGGL